MDLLQGYIGIRGIDDAPDSGIYVNQLPGISLKGIQSIADEEQVTFAKVWADVQKRAGLRIARELRTRMKARFNIKSNRGIYNLASVDRGDEVDAEAKYKGVVYETGSDRNGFFAFFIHSLSIDLPDFDFGSLTNPITIKIFDILGIELDTFELINPVVGINNIKVNKEYNSSKIFVAYDATEIPAKNTALVEADTDAWRYGITSVYGCGCEPQAYGASASLTNPLITQMLNCTFGISAVISPICSYNSLIAYNKPLIADAWLYLLGAELMLERIYSPRINKFTTVDAESAEELRDVFTAQYEKAFNDFVQGIEINAEDGCIECKETVSVRQRLP